MGGVRGAGRGEMKQERQRCRGEVCSKENMKNKNGKKPHPPTQLDSLYLDKPLWMRLPVFFGGHIIQTIALLVYSYINQTNTNTKRKNQKKL